MNTDYLTAENAKSAETDPRTSVRAPGLTVVNGDWRMVNTSVADKSVQCCVTSPPYWGLRRYLPKGHPLAHLEIGQEKLPDCLAWAKGELPCGHCFVCSMRAVFGGKNNPVGVWRVLRDDGTVWLNLGDSYAAGGNGSSNTPVCKQNTNRGFAALKANGRKAPPAGLKHKDLIGIPWRVALALQADGWFLRSDIVWAKQNCMPESVTDRPTRSHEYLFLLTKSPRYFYDHEAIKEPCIYDVDGTGTAARKAMAHVGDKGFPTAERNGMRSGGYKNSVNFEGKNKGNDKQRGHSRRHDGFNSRWDAMEKDEQCAGMRNKRDVWTIAPANYPEAHFATFPPALIKPCILAGTSARGCCAQCGSPFVRVIERGDVNLEHQRACGGDANGEYNGAITKDHAAHGVQDASAVKARILEGMRERITTGWEPTCQCDLATGQTLQPCVVLDPFGGSGTTGQVSLELGRRVILCELNEGYLPLIERRTNITPGLSLA
jgi:DNA modification methylase